DVLGLSLWLLVEYPAHRVGFEMERGLEESPQPIEVGLADRVVLVVVALGTAYLQAEEHASHRGAHVVEHHVATLFDKIDVGHVGPAEGKSRGDRGELVTWLQKVARDLQFDELVV